MNNDLISRDALKEKIQEIVEAEMPIDEKWAMGLRHSLKLIDKAPAVEPEITDEDLQAAMTESWHLGYELAETKFKRPQWNVSYLHEDSITKPMTGGKVVPDILQGWRYEERPTGEWLPVYPLTDKCSICNGEALDFNEYPYRSKFCPHCGAKMKGGETVAENDMHHPGP